MKTPAIVLGVDSEVLDPSKKLSLLANIREKKASGQEPWRTAALMCSVTDGLCSVHYLSGEWREARQWGRELVDSVDYYLFGDWRDHAVTDNGNIAPDWWFSNGIGWTLELANGLCWGSVFGVWEKVDQFLRFPTESITKDTEGAVPRAYYIGLANWWSHPKKMSGLEAVKGMRGAGCKDYHLRCDVLLAIAAGDATLVSKSFEKYLKFWLKNMKTSPQRLAKEAAFLWHVAHREGLSIELPEDFQMHVLMIPSE